MVDGKRLIPALGQGTAERSLILHHGAVFVTHVLGRKGPFFQFLFQGLFEDKERQAWSEDIKRFILKELNKGTDKKDLSTAISQFLQSKIGKMPVVVIH